MKVAIFLLTVTVWAAFDASVAGEKTADHHHVVKHVTYIEGHGDAGKDAKHATHKHVKQSGHKAEHDQERALKKNKEAVSHKVEDAERGGKKTKSFEEDSHQTHKKSGAHSEHGAKYKNGSREKKNHFSKGFREQYHKDEHKKRDAFYSNNHKSGEYRIYGARNQKYHDHHHDKDNHGKYVSKKYTDQYGKDGKKTDGFKYSSRKGFQQENGKDKYYMKHNKWSKKNGKNHPASAHRS